MEYDLLKGMTAWCPLVQKNLNRGGLPARASLSFAFQHFKSTIRWHSAVTRGHKSSNASSIRCSEVS